MEFVTNGICIKYVLAGVKFSRINAKNNNSGKFAEIKITVVSFYLGIIIAPKLTICPKYMNKTSSILNVAIYAFFLGKIEKFVNLIDVKH